MNQYKDKDPIDYVLNILYKKKIVDEKKLDLIHSGVKEKIQACVDFAESSEIYNSFNSDKKPLSVLLRYDLKNEPKAK